MLQRLVLWVLPAGLLLAAGELVLLFTLPMTTPPVPADLVNSVVHAQPPAPTPVPSLLGDPNGDGTVSGIDLAIFGQNFGRTGAGNVADLNRDGAVNGVDLAILTQNFGKTNPTPVVMPPSSRATPTPVITPPSR